MKSSDNATTSSSSTDSISPSAARRKALRQSATSTTSIVPTVPIKNYYALTDRLYASFSVALDNRELDHAYVWGIRFATFSTEALPRHPSYNNNNTAFAKLRKRNAQRTQQVLTQLEAVTARMDAEERLKEQQRQRRLQQQEEERKHQLERQKKREQAEAEEEERKRLEILQQEYKKEQQEKIRLEEKSKKNARHQQAVKNSALAKLASLQQQQQKSASSLSDPTSALAATTTTTNGRAGTKDVNNDVTSTAQAKLSALRKSSQGSTEREMAASALLEDTQSKATSMRATGPQQQQPQQQNHSQQQRQQQQHQLQQQRDDKADDVNDFFNPVKDLSKEEKQTIDLLQQTIARQEARIQDIVQVKIPAWRQQAKAKLAAGQRKEALHCIYHKRRWQRTVDFLKESIFQMETQILHIQSAAQDREVENVLQAAKDAMQAIHETRGLADSDAVENAMNEIGQGGLLPASLSEDDALLEHGDDGDDDVNVEDLLHEILAEEESADNAVASAKAAGSSSSMDLASWLPKDVLSLLALPSAPTESKPTKEDAPEKTESSGLLKAVLG